MDTCYAPLRLQSNWSLLRGASPPEAYLEQAARWGLPALALTDGNLFGAVPFFEGAKRFGVKPILGATVNGGKAEAVLLVEDEKGYANLCRILTKRDLEEGFSLEAALCEHGTGLILLTRDGGLAHAVGDAYEGRIYLEVSENRPPSPCGRALPFVATGDIFFARPPDHEVQRLLSAFRLGTTLAGLDPSKAAKPGDFLRAPSDMAHLFRDRPEALRNTRSIAERCAFDLLSRKTVFPRVAGKEAPRILLEHALAGIRSRYGRILPRAWNRVHQELDVIVRMGFADYFLVVEEIVRHARSLGTPTAGRGSGAGSMVAYVLGITNVDPLEYDLPFERFLNPGRRDYPDLDVDFCWRLRDDVIDYAFQRFGRERVAMIATYATFQPRLALRETAKAFGLSNPVITKIARKLRQGISRSRFNTLPADPGVLERVLDLARRIKGFPHHLSVHCGGVVIVPDRLACHAPLLRAEKGVVITAYDKNGVERVGLVKLDLLGNRSLSTISETVRRIRERTGERVDPERLPANDARTFALVREGRTVGCGQLESPAMRHLLRQMQPGGVRNIMEALALIRPGAAGMGMKEAFIRRKRGLEAVPDLPAALRGVLGETFGVMVYEEDAMRIAMALCGFSPGEADRFRRAMTKGGNNGEEKALVRKFLLCCGERGMGRDRAEELLRHMEKFRSYSFCRAHAASYAVLAYASAFLKTHHPLEYWTAALNNNEGMYPKWVLVEEAKRAGVEVMGPCVNRSDLEFTVEGDSIRSGVGCIAALSRRTMEGILEGGPFDSLEDLVARARPREGEVELLIRCGALDVFGLARNHLQWRVMTSFRKMQARACEAGGLGFGKVFPARFPATAVPDLPPLSHACIWRDEWEIMGFTPREHPLRPFREALQRAGVTQSSEIPKNVHRPLRLAGIIAAVRRIQTEKGALMQFLTLDDEAGVFEVVLFPDAYRRARFLLDGPGPYLVEGRVEDQYGALAVNAQRLEPFQNSIQ